MELHWIIHHIRHLIPSSWYPKFLTLWHHTLQIVFLLLINLPKNGYFQWHEFSYVLFLLLHVKFVIFMIVTQIRTQLDASFEDVLILLLLNYGDVLRELKLLPQLNVSNAHALFLLHLVFDELLANCPPQLFGALLLIFLILIKLSGFWISEALPHILYYDDFSFFHILIVLLIQISVFLLLLEHIKYVITFLLQLNLLLLFYNVLFLSLSLLLVFKDEVFLLKFQLLTLISLFQLHVQILHPSYA